MYTGHSTSVRTPITIPVSVRSAENTQQHRWQEGEPYMRQSKQTKQADKRAKVASRARAVSQAATGREEAADVLPKYKEPNYTPRSMRKRKRT